MTRRNVCFAVLVVVLGGLQAWDSGVLKSSGLSQLLVATAIAVPALALLLSSDYGTQAAAVLVSLMLLTAARLLAPSPLPTLHLIGFFPALLILGSRVAGARKATG